MIQLKQRLSDPWQSLASLFLGVAFHLSALIIDMLLTHSTAHAAAPVETPPISFRAGSWAVSSQTDFFQTEANFGETRTQYERLPGDNSLTHFVNTLRGRYHTNSSLALFGGLSLASTRTVDPVNEKTNTGVGEFFAGAYLPMSLKKTRWIAEVDFSFPGGFGGLTAFETPVQRTPILNDATPFVRGRIHVSHKIGGWQLAGFLGARVPTDGLASTALYMASIGRTLSSVWSATVGVHGFETLLSDQRSRVDRVSFANTANAGSFHFRGYNPALTQLFMSSSIAITPSWRMKFGFDYPLMGLNTSFGQTVTVFLQYDFVPALRKRPKVRPEDRVTAPGNVPNFKIDAEEVDPTVIAPESDFEPTGRDDLNETERILKEGN